MINWSEMTKEELALIHHALRMLAKYPAEAEEATQLADQAWAEVARRVSA